MHQFHCKERLNKARDGRLVLPQRDHQNPNQGHKLTFGVCPFALSVKNDGWYCLTVADHSWFPTRSFLRGGNCALVVAIAEAIVADDGEMGWILIGAGSFFEIRANYQLL